MILDDLVQHIHNQSIAVRGTSLFKGYLPSEPDFCIGVLDTGGEAPEIDVPIRKPTFQIMLRHTSYTAGKAKLEEIYTAFHGKANTQLVPDGTYFYYILAISNGGHIGRDERGRDEFSINFQTKTR